MPVNYSFSEGEYTFGGVKLVKGMVYLYTGEGKTTNAF